MKNLVEIQGVPFIKIRHKDGTMFYRGLGTDELQEWYTKNIEGVYTNECRQTRTVSARKNKK